MNSRRILVLALLLGLVAALLANVYINNVKKSILAGKVKKVVYTRQAIPAKTTITREMLEVKDVPAQLVTSEMYGDVKDVVGKITRYDLSAGEPVLKNKVAGGKEGAAAGLAYAVPKGMRAVTISVNAITGVNGFVRPGDRVDLAVTADVERPVAGGNKERVAINRIIVQNLEVLAVEKTTAATDNNSSSSKKNKDTDLHSITLAVPVEYVRQVLLANDRGVLHVLLRSPVEDGRAPAEPFAINEFLQ
ncbi:MAG: pilus assembly protein CpaB [Eubacteriales bacterium]|nr:pilus assembly protein CpaB [Eubacteriales bacterium]MDN5363631.1 pilus assembly protein CpaB [Eubacteriales bacterium]